VSRHCCNGGRVTHDALIDPQRWRDCWLWYRNAPHQEEAILRLYKHLKETDPSLLSVNAEWFVDYTKRDQLVHSFMFPEGE
jgi:hypothetical protein